MKVREIMPRIKKIITEIEDDVIEDKKKSGRKRNDEKAMENQHRIDVSDIKSPEFKNGPLVVFRYIGRIKSDIYTRA